MTLVERIRLALVQPRTYGQLREALACEAFALDAALRSLIAERAIVMLDGRYRRPLPPPSDDPAEQRREALRRNRALPDGHKRCTGCRHVQPLADFYVDRRASDGRQSHCRRCAIIAKRRA